MPACIRSIKDSHLLTLKLFTITTLESGMLAIWKSYCKQVHLEEENQWGQCRKVL